MRDEDLPRLLSCETERVEFKRAAGQRDPILHAVCAMANDLGGSGAPGYVVVGVDNTGQVTGLIDADLDQQQKDLADRLRSGKIQPVPSASVTLTRHGGRPLIIVEVASYPTPPIVEVDGIAWVRVGTTTRRATEADLARLAEHRPSRSIPFDTRPLPGAALEDLELQHLQAAWSAARASDVDPDSYPEFGRWLQQRQWGRVDRQPGAPFQPNPAAILLHGKSPQDQLPGAWVDLVRYGGSDVDSPVLSRRPCTGTLTDQLDAAWAWIGAQVESVPEGADGIREGFVPNYPLEALKELVRNLVQHRQYEGTNAPGRIEWLTDRIEFSNPGGPFGRASEGAFGTHSDYRNPLITAKLVEAGYVQQLGRGVRRARQQLLDNGNPPLEAATDGFTRIVVRRRR